MGAGPRPTEDAARAQHLPASPRSPLRQRLQRPGRLVARARRRRRSRWRRGRLRRPGPGPAARAAAALAGAPGRRHAPAARPRPHRRRRRPRGRRAAGPWPPTAAAAWPRRCGRSTAAASEPAVAAPRPNGCIACRSAVRSAGRARTPRARRGSWCRRSRTR